MVKKQKSPQNPGHNSHTSVANNSHDDTISTIETETAIQIDYNTQDVINNILKISLESHDLKTQLEHILDYILTIKSLQLLPQAAILLANNKSEALVLIAERGFSIKHKTTCKNVPFGTCYCGRAATTKKIQFVSCITDQHDITFEDMRPHGHYCVPIIKDTGFVGVICLYVAEGHIHTQREEDLLVAISNIVAGIIDNRKIHDQLINSVNNLKMTVMALEEEKKFSDSIIKGLTHGLIVTDLDFVVLKSNPMAKIILQPFNQNLNGKSIDEIFGIETAERIISSGAYSPSTVCLPKDIILTTEDGMEKIINFSIVPREGLSSKEVGYIILFNDITELTYVRKEMEKMNRLSTVAEIASAVAHEVRNPLAGIKIMAQSIQEDPENIEEQMECSHRIIKQVNRLNELLSEFFSYARPVTPKRSPTSIESILAEIKPLITNKLMKKNIRLVEKYPEQTSIIMADPNQMQQVFLNLFLNSIDAIDDSGKVIVEIGKPNLPLLNEYKRKHPGVLTGANHIQVLFSDTGCGITPKIIDKVFEPFFTTKTTGTGLGLSIVYRILTENKVAILTRSNQNKGTTFTMFFEIFQERQEQDRDN